MKLEWFHWLGVTVYFAVIGLIYLAAGLAKGEAIGTHLKAQQIKTMAKKQWLADHLRLSGKVTLDDGAIKALRQDGKSLLPVYGRVLSVDLTEDTGPWSDFLGTADPFVRISRLINVNLEFQTFSQVFLPRRKFGDLLEMPLSRISVPLILLFPWVWVSR